MGAQKFLIRGGPLDCIKNNSSNDRAQVKPKITITKGQKHSRKVKHVQNVSSRVIV